MIVGQIQGHILYYEPLPEPASKPASTPAWSKAIRLPVSELLAITPHQTQVGGDRSIGNHGIGGRDFCIYKDSCFTSL